MSFNPNRKQPRRTMEIYHSLRPKILKIRHTLRTDWEWDRMEKIKQLDRHAMDLINSFGLQIRTWSNRKIALLLPKCWEHLDKVFEETEACYKKYCRLKRRLKLKRKVTVLHSAYRRSAFPSKWTVTSAAKISTILSELESYAVLRCTYSLIEALRDLPINAVIEVRSRDDYDAACFAKNVAEFGGMILLSGLNLVDADKIYKGALGEGFQVLVDSPYLVSAID